VDRGERRGQDHPLDAAVKGGAQHAQRPVASRHDQLVGILGLRGRKRRRDVQHVPAPVDRRRPSIVGG
jgi:hypothetical protein